MEIGAIGLQVKNCQVLAKATRSQEGVFPKAFRGSVALPKP